MSIPLDRLYNFLNDICNRAVLIYRWAPHGSKKLEDLSPLHDLPPGLWRDRSMPLMIGHDQEPLFYDLYSESNIRAHLSTITYNDDPGFNCWMKSLLDFLSAQHLRGILLIDKMSYYDKTLILHSEQRSKELKKYEANGYIGVYWWSHAAIAADWFRYAQHDPILSVNFDKIQKDFLIYNRAWSGSREYRLTFMSELVQHRLHKNCVTSFSEYDSGQSYLDHVFQNPKLQVDLTALASNFPANTHDASSSADYNNKDYSSTAIEIVLETLFDDSRLHLTEKTLRPIACGRPFMLMSPYGSLQYLRDYGFQTFDQLIDETYDTIEDPAQRLQAVIKEMGRISALPQVEKHRLWLKLYEISKFNQRLFFSHQWQQSIQQEFLTNLTQSLSVLEQYKNKIIQTEMDRIWKDDPASKIYYIN